MTGQEGGLHRRSFLGACAAAGAGMAGACSLWGGQDPDPAGEAAQTGDTGWRITDTGADDAIEGYAAPCPPTGGPKARTCCGSTRRAGTAGSVTCRWWFGRRPGPAPRPQDALVTTDFRSSPGADPESSLTGVLYEGYPVDAPYVVHRPEHWAFAGTGVRAGDSFDHLVGAEYDRVTPEAPTPEGIEIVAHSPLVCNGTASHQDSAYYTVDSGAGVFAVGTMRWVEALMAGTDENGGNHGMDARTGEFVTRVTENVRRTFAEGPAAPTHPAHGNVPELYGDRT
ncbi:N,N-dimethylformamidase beta subunit family domain-containing protein [Streptomyces xiamenensis]